MRKYIKYKHVFYFTKSYFLDLNRCYTQPTPCLNNGVCVPGVSGAYTCSCTAQYTGALCATLIPPICSYCPVGIHV